MSYFLWHYYDFTYREHAIDQLCDMFVSQASCSCDLH